MASKPVKKVTTVKKPVVKKPLKPIAKSVKTGPVRKVSSKKAADSAAYRSYRVKNLAKVVVVAAALVAISLGLMTYNNDKQTTVAVSPGQGVIFLQSPDGSVAKAGSTVSVDMYETSGNEPVNALQGAVTYPADRLEVVSVKTGSAFPQEAATDTATPGLVRLARSIKTQSSPITGTKQVATISFKVLKDDSTPLQMIVDQDRSLLVRSTDNQNILKANTAPKLEFK